MPDFNKILEKAKEIEKKMRESQENLKKMAKIVDKQNEGDPEYQNMSPNFDKSISFKAA